MDLVINSQIQSPLVRTLARTKGKSQSFTHNIPDNVPPCSFSKIVIAPQNGTTKFGSTYKLKIPQYGYLRDVILKYTTQENIIPAAVASIVQRLYSFRQFVNLGAVQAIGSYDQTFLSTFTTNTSGNQNNPNFSWFNCQKTLATSNASTVGAGLQNGFYNVTSSLLSFMQSITPQFQQLYHNGGSASTLSGTVVPASMNGAPDAITAASAAIARSTNPVLKNVTSSSYAAATYYNSDYTTLTDTTVVFELDQFIDCGDADIWSSFMTLWYNIYLLAQNDTSSDTSGGSYKIAKLVLNELQSLPPRTISMPLYSANNIGLAATYRMKNVSGNSVSPIIDNPNNINYTVASPAAVSGAIQYTSVTLPGWIKAVTKGERILLVPRIPTLVFDDNGKITGCQFVALDLMHPQDNAATYAQTFLGQLQTTSASESLNNRVFAFENSAPGSEEWNMWDWQTDTFRYPLMAANLASSVTLTTHNRPVQTIFPRETVARINRMGYEDRLRYLKMMEPRISDEGQVGPSGNPGAKVQYFPLFLASTENPSLNFDTRFVEQLDLDVAVQPYVNSHVSSDVAQAGASAPLSIPDYVRAIISTLFDAQVTNSLTYTSTVVSHAYNSTLLANMVDLYKNGQNSSFINNYINVTPRDYVLSLRNYQNTFQDYIKVEALLYYHNFHDGTSQAIRDSNFKPGTPASLLMYNTYQETERLLTQSELQNTKDIIIQLTTNNLVFGTTFMVRRRNIANPSNANKLDHLMNTLPIKKVTLTGSGQQLYTADLDETQLTDAWDYDLASGKVGRKYNNGVMIQAIDDPVTGDSFHLYYIPYSFSSDMTYNSGSVAFQTINNPVLTIVVDAGLNASQPFTINTVDAEYSIEVYHNYWNMVRIDSNTGAITKSLDL